MKPNRVKNGELVQFTLRIDKKTHEAIKQRALLNKRSITKEIEYTLGQEVKNN